VAQPVPSSRSEAVRHNPKGRQVEVGGRGAAPTSGIARQSEDASRRDARTANSLADGVNWACGSCTAPGCCVFLPWRSGGVASAPPPATLWQPSGLRGSAPFPRLQPATWPCQPLPLWRWRIESPKGPGARRGAPQTIPRSACNDPLPIPASLFLRASLKESLNREWQNPKRDLSAMSLVIQGF
jgi:hypothetical protein